MTSEPALVADRMWVMPDQETRVVLVKPGDVLLFGNVGDLPAEAIDAGTEQLLDATGVAKVIFFRDDIDMAALPATAAEAHRRPDDDVYVVQTSEGFTGTFDQQTVGTLERLGLVQHDHDGHVMETAAGEPVGPLHHFYVQATT
jgi:hypothetical protein